MTGDNTRDKVSDDNEIQAIEKNTEATPPKAASETKENNIAPKVATKSKSAAKKWLMTSTILLLVLTLILVIAGYKGKQIWSHYQNEQEQRLNALEKVTAQQNNRIESLGNQQSQLLESQQETLAKLENSQEAIQQRLDSHTQRLRTLVGTSRDDWLLAEARYLLRLANQRLLVERGTEGAQALLESADKILLSIDDAEILPVREAIANEIMQLKLAKTVDRQGLYLQLGALKHQVQSLPLVPFREHGDQPKSETSIEPISSEQKTWYQRFLHSIRKAFKQLGQFVKVRDHAEKPNLLISEREQLNTINQISLLFEQAQFALLHEEEMIYRVSLEEVVKWLDQYYSHYDEYEVLHSETLALKQQPIVQSLPTIHRSSELLTDYIERFHRLNATEDKMTEKDASPTTSTEHSKEL